MSSKISLDIAFRATQWQVYSAIVGLSEQLRPRDRGIGLLAQAVNRRFRPPDEQGTGLAPSLATLARPIAAKPRPSGNWQGAAKLAA